jgi:hypothetical protein
MILKHQFVFVLFKFVPIVVAVPPMLDAKLTEKHNIARMFFSSSLLEFDPFESDKTCVDFGSSGSSATDVERTSSRIASRIGIIMAQAAVLEIHLESMVNKKCKQIVSKKLDRFNITQQKVARSNSFCIFTYSP